MTTSIVQSVRAEYLRYKSLAESAIAQLDDGELSLEPVASGANSIATLCWHISGNLQSRFTEFLTSDGEKPWRHRDQEFEPRTVSRSELIAYWQRGWQVLLDTLDRLHDEDLGGLITIRGQSLEVHQALHRSLAHASYHAGQIVYIAKSLRGERWISLSIPPGRSEDYRLAQTGQPDQRSGSPEQ